MFIIQENDIAIIFLEKPLPEDGPIDFKFAQLPNPDDKYESNDAEIMEWGSVANGGKIH